MVTSPRSPSKHLLSPKNTRIPDEALYLALQQFLDNWHFIIMKSSLGKSMDRREALEMSLHVLSMNGVRFTADEISELVQTEEEVMMYEVVDRIPESLREGFEHLTLELLVVVTTASRMRTTVENNEPEPIQALNNLIAASRQVMLIAAWAGWANAMYRGKAERNLTQRYETELQEADEGLESFKVRHIENIRKVILQNLKRENQDLMCTVLNDWKDQAQRLKAESWTLKKVETVQLTIGRAAKEMCARAKKVLGRMLDEEKGASIASCFSSWVIFSASYKHDRSFEENLKHFERQMKVYKAKKKEDAALILSRVSAATDSGLAQQTLAAWMTYTFDGQTIRKLEGKVYGYDDRLVETKKHHRRIAYNLSGRTGDQIDLNTQYQCWSAWTSVSKTSRLDKYFSVKIDRKKKQLSNLQVLFQNFADELETGLGAKEQEEDSGRKHAEAMSGAVSLPDIHAKKHM